MTNGRPSQRVPSRTPPFVLVGLLVILCILGYSYWSLSASNSNLSSQLEVVRIEKSDKEAKHAEAEKILEETRQAVAALQVQANDLKEKLTGKETENNQLKAEITQRDADSEKQKTLIEQCDERLSVIQKDLDTANSEKSNLQLTLDTEREKTSVCTMESCHGPVQQVLEIASKLVGSDKMRSGLLDSHLDADTLMNGINHPAPEVPVAPQDQQNQQKVQEQPQLRQVDQQQQTQEQLQPKPVTGTEAEGRGNPYEEKENIAAHEEAKLDINPPAAIATLGNAGIAANDMQDAVNTIGIERGREAEKLKGIESNGPANLGNQGVFDNLSEAKQGDATLEKQMEVDQFKVQEIEDEAANGGPEVTEQLKWEIESKTGLGDAAEIEGSHMEDMQAYNTGMKPDEGHNFQNIVNFEVKKGNEPDE